MNIRLARKSDISSLNILFKEVIRDLKEVKKIDMLWGDIYPFCEFDNDIKNKEMYVIENNNKVIGSFVLSDYDDPDYHQIKWNQERKSFFYLNRLAILPSEQGMGYAKATMKFIDNYAIKNNYDVIRLTVYENNINAIKLYEKNGFKRIEEGNWSLEDKIFIGFEKIME